MICSTARRLERLREASRPKGVESLSRKSLRCIDPAGRPESARKPQRHFVSCHGLAET